MSVLFDTAIYVNRSTSYLDKLFPLAGYSPVQTEKKRWKSGKDDLGFAKKTGKDLVVIFADMPELTYWAIVDSITLSAKSTSYRFSKLTRFQKEYQRKDLTLKSTGRPLSNSFQRSYAIVNTPTFLRKQVDLRRLDAIDHSTHRANGRLELSILESDFEPSSIEDGRRWINAIIQRRQGQSAFRATLLSAYDHCCAITSCDAVEVLEAAHILSYQGNHTHHVQNGILLRADFHTLFDLGRIAINTNNMTVIMSSFLKGSQYWDFAGKPVRLPKQLKARPNIEALNKHRNYIFKN